jgi:hypothetical protein
MESDMEFTDFADFLAAKHQESRFLMARLLLTIIEKNY